MRFTPVLSVAFLSLFLTACGPEVVFQRSYDLPQAGWTYADSLDFKVEVRDSLAIYDLLLDLSHATTFPQQNVYVQIHTEFPDGERLHKVVSLELADKAGVWYGRCRSDWCKLTIPLQEGTFFDAPGAYRITLEQYSRTDTLQGVKSLGLRLVDTGQKRLVQN